MTFEYVLKKNGLNPQKDLVLDDSIKFDLMAGAFAGGSLRMSSEDCRSYQGQGCAGVQRAAHGAGR